MSNKTKSYVKKRAIFFAVETAKYLFLQLPLAIIALPLLVLLFPIAILFTLGRMLFKRQSWQQACRPLGALLMQLIIPKTQANSPGLPYDSIELSPATPKKKAVKLDIFHERFASENERPTIILFFGGNAESASSYRFQECREVFSPDEPCIIYGYNRRTVLDEQAKAPILSSAQDIYDCADKVFDFVQAKHPGSRILCVGLSAGGAEATHVVAQKHQLSASDEGVLKPTLINLNSFSKVSRVMLGTGVKIFKPGLGHILGGLVGLFTKMLGADLKSDQNWRAIPENYKDYMVIQGDKKNHQKVFPERLTRFDRIITDLGALHNAKTIKSKRKELKKRLKLLAKRAADQKDVATQALAKDILTEIKDHKTDIAGEYFNESACHCLIDAGVCRETGVPRVQKLYDIAHQTPEQRKERSDVLNARFQRYAV